MSELKETEKMKVVQPHEKTPKQFSNQTQDPKNNPFGPQKVRNDPIINSKPNVRIERN